MLRQPHKLFQIALIAAVAWLALATAGQAAYEYHKKVTVDHTRVAGLDVTPPAGYSFVKGITIDNTQVSGTSDLVDFPVLVSIHNDATIKTTVNGGRVTDLQGDDIVFYASDLTTVLKYEVEQYDGATGTLVAWVRLAVQHDVDTVFYLAYGNSGISSPQGDALNVWDSNFKGVWHMQEEAAGTGNTDVYKDSTANANHGDDDVSATGQTGKMHSGQEFDGVEDQMNFGSDASLNIRNAITMSAWVNLSARPAKDDWMSLYVKGDYKYQLYIQGADTVLTTLGAYFELDTGSEDLWDLTSIDIDPADGWAHVAVTFDGTDVKFYVNGVLDHTENAPGIIDDSAGSDLVFGDGESDWIGSSVDEIRISDTDRSADWIATEYNNQNSPGGFITIQEGGPLAHFPVLVSIQNDEQLKTDTNGGQVTDAEGDDIIFSSDAIGNSPLYHEVESYDGDSGSLVAWVLLPSLSVAADTVFYLHYGNSAVTDPTEDPEAIWDSSYRGVWHLNEATDATNMDSTSYSNDGSPSGSPAATTAGKIAGALDFTDANDFVDVGTCGIFENLTLEGWVQPQNIGATIETYLRLGGGGDAIVRHDGENSQGQVHFYIRTDGVLRHLRVNGQLSDDTWIHLAGTWDGTDQRIYINGQEADSQQPGGVQTDPTQGSIGSSTSSADAIIDEVRYSDIARSADWIATGYNNQRWPNKAQSPATGFLTVERAVCDLATPVTCPSTTADAIETEGAWDAFELELLADTRLEIYTTGTTDTYGHLYDSTCTEIAQNDTANYNFNISQTVTAGTYYVQVRHASESGTGAYDLNVECKDDDHGDSIDEATALDCGSPTGGSIDIGGDEDYFKVVFWGTGILTAYTSGDTDTQGTLLDDAENIIGADDNSGAGDNFKIVQSVSPGLYYVVVTGSASGDYSVQVDCEYTPVITATAEYGGSISPAGAVGVSYGTDQTFTITPDAGNTVRDVWVDGVWVGAVPTHTFNNVQTDHKIVAVFNADFENCVDIPDIPLDAWYRSAPANVMFVLDDSGSMDWEFMTTDGDGLFDGYYYYVFDDAGDNLYGRVLPDDKRMKWQSQWAGHNKLYYDPAVTYEPWPNHVANDPALTLDPADKVNPRSHPMVASKTFSLNGTYVQYTNDAIASAITINDRDISGFSKTPDAAGGQTLLDTGFDEDLDPWPWDGWFENDNWNPDDQQSISPDYSALATNNSAGNLTSDDLDASDADSITVDFSFMKNLHNADEVSLYYYDYDGNQYDFIADLDTGDDDDWLPYHDTITESKYFKSNFRIRFGATITHNNKYVRLDDVVITKDNGTVGWEAATDGGEAHNGDYWWTASDGDYTAKWEPDIPAAGDYDVYARWHADAHHSETVPYTINYAGGGSDTVERNQRLNGGSWVLLGTYSFDPGTGGNVTISYTRSGDFDRVCADAVKFVPAGAIDVIDIKRAHYYTWSESAGKPYLVVLDGDIAYYAVTDANSNNQIDSGEIAAAVSPPADVQTGRTYDQERQNFANWYQFYRRRELSATAAVARTIAGLKGVQVGFYSINGNLVQPVVAVKSSGIDKSKNLLQTLYGLNIRAQGTPLRLGLREVGKYFANSSAMIGSSPYATPDNGGACQQAFTIVMTDGFWNGPTPSVGNTDGDDNTTFDGGGYADIYKNTLADVAMKYYENDLHTGLDDNVPTNAVDSATHQHMVTYAVSFGRVGSLDPADYDIANGSYPVWPDPRYVGEHKIDDLWHAAVNGRGEFLNAASPTELVDSLLAISRSIESRITSSSSVSVNGDPLYQELSSQIRMYQATYRSDGWTGDINAYKIDTASGEVDATADWSAADLLATLNWDTGRIIATSDGSLGIPFRYDSNVLSASQQRALGSDLDPDSPAEQNAVKILNYLRGERDNEAQSGGTFRDRFQVLGDIVHSSPVYHKGVLYAGGNDGMLHAFDAADGDELFAYVPNLVFGNLSALVNPDYSHKYFVDLSPTIRDVTLSTQAKTILVGGLGKGGKGYYALDVTNAADITDEDTLAARVLWEFPDPQSEGMGYLAYDSRIAPIAVDDIVKTQADVAVARIVAIPVADMLGGTGILDLTFASGKGMFQDGEDLTVGGVKVAEAVGGLYDPYMGYSYSRPVIVKSNWDGAEWLVIFGNGYNSSKSHAVLYILNLATGELIKRIDTGVGNCNGLSGPIAIDVDSDGTVDYVYAGDLQGNLWKFDLHDPAIAEWKVAYEDPAGNPAPVFQAKNFSGHPQPITSKPDVMYHCSQEGYMVIFGTGRYLAELDLESSETSSVYGIWDYGDDDDNHEYLGSFERGEIPQLDNPHLDGVETRERVKLLEQTVEPGSWTTTDGRNLRVITDHEPKWGTVADNDGGQSNPQPDPGSTMPGDTVHAGWYFDLPKAGEMAVSDVIIRDGKVLVISFTPGQDPCGFGGSSILHSMQACSGARSDDGVFVDIIQVVYNPVSGDETTIDRNSGDWKEPTGVEYAGRLQPPVILRPKGSDSEFYYNVSSNSEIFKQEAAAPKLGIFYWMQME